MRKSFAEHIAEVQEVWGGRVPDLALIFLTDRDERFRSANDQHWGAGNWERCTNGCLDGNGYPAYHHIDYHRELFHVDGPFDQAHSELLETSSRFPKLGELVIARITEPKGEFWRCWHVARTYDNDSIKGVCGAWITYDGSVRYTGQEFEWKEPKDFDPEDSTIPGYICGRRGCVEQFVKLGLHY